MSKTAFVDREALERKLESRLVQLQEEGVSDGFMNGVALALALVINEPTIELVEDLEKVPNVKATDAGLYTAHDVAEIIADLLGDTCACKFGTTDEWLPLKCELLDACPHVVGVACWEQYLKHKSEKEE